MKENSNLISKIELEDIEQEALIEAAKMIATNPHADLDFERKRIVSEKLNEIKKQRELEEKIKEDKNIQETYKSLLDDFHEAIKEELRIWQEEDRIRDEQRQQRLSEIIERIETDIGLNLREREREKERKIRINLEKLNSITNERRKNDDDNFTVISVPRKVVKSQAKVVEIYQNIFDYYQDNRRKLRKDLSKNIIKADNSTKTNVFKESFKENLKSFIDHKKALREVNKKSTEQSINEVISNEK